MRLPTVADSPILYTLAVEVSELLSRNNWILPAIKMAMPHAKAVKINRRVLTSFEGMGVTLRTPTDTVRAMRRTTRSFAAVVGLLALASCGSSSPTTTEVQAPAAASPEATSAPTVPATITAETPPTPALISDPPPSIAPTVAETAAPVVVPEALQFQGTLVGGGDIDFAQFAGQPVALWFWAPG
jgi:hypothetical protein